MESLQEPIQINRKFIKMISTHIIPKYNKTLQELFEIIKQEILDQKE